MTVGLIYVRQSRQRKGVRTVSPETQEAACRSRPEIQACDEVVVFRDLNKSGGGTAKRKDYQAMCAQIEAERRPGAVRVVALYDQSRGFRNKLDAYRFFALLESRPWIEVVFGDGSTFDRTNSGELTYSIKAAVAEFERKEVGRRMRDSLRWSISQGEMVGPVPLGYRRRREGAHVHIELDPEWAPFIERIFREYATGRWSARKLATRLNAEGIRPPTFEGGIRADTLAQMFSSPAYIGMTREGGRKAMSGPLVRGRWPAIIDMDTWDTVPVHPRPPAPWRSGRSPEAHLRIPGTPALWLLRHEDVRPHDALRRLLPL